MVLVNNCKIPIHWRSNVKQGRGGDQKYGFHCINPYFGLFQYNYVNTKWLNLTLSVDDFYRGSNFVQFPPLCRWSSVLWCNFSSSGKALWSACLLPRMGGHKYLVYLTFIPHPIPQTALLNSLVFWLSWEFWKAVSSLFKQTEWDN